MLAEVCRFYGWAWNDVLSMQAIHFFLMLGEARALHAREMSEKADLSIIPALDVKYYQDSIKPRYAWAFDRSDEFRDPQAPSTINPASLKIETHESAQDHVLQLFATQRRFLGHE